MPPRPAEARPEPPGGQDLLVAVLPALLVPLLGALIYFVAYAGEPWARAAYVLVKLYTVIWPLLATVLILRERLPRLSAEAEALSGIIHLLDVVQDDAAANGRWAFPNEE